MRTPLTAWKTKNMIIIEKMQVRRENNYIVIPKAIFHPHPQLELKINRCGVSYKKYLNSNGEKIGHLDAWSLLMTCAWFHIKNMHTSSLQKPK